MPLTRSGQSTRPPANTSWASVAGHGPLLPMICTPNIISAVPAGTSVPKGPAISLALGGGDMLQGRLPKNYTKSTSVPAGSSAPKDSATSLTLGRGDVLRKRLPKSFTKGPSVPTESPQKQRPFQQNSKTINKKTNLYIGTYNVRTLSTDMHLTDLESEIRNVKWDIIGISEVRRPGEELIELRSKHLLYSYGKEKVKQSGVGFLINKNLKDNVTGFKAVSDRVASVTIQLSKRYKLNIIQVYAPTSQSTQQEIDNFYDDLNSLLQGTRKHFNVIMGDFNAQVGQGNEHCVGKFGYKIRNERGEDLVNFATANGFKIMNTFFKKGPSRKWTWRSPNHETRNEIDYILTDKNDIVKDIQVLNQVNVGSDHRMVRCKVQINTNKERRKMFHTKPQPLNIPKEHVQSFKLELKNRFRILTEQDSTNINELSSKMTTSIIEVASTFKPMGKQPISKISDETKNLMEKRRNLKPPTTTREKIEEAELNKLIKKKRREDRRRYTTAVIESTLEKGRGFKAINKLLNSGRRQITSILEENGNLTTDRDRIVERAKEFYQKLYSSKQGLQNNEQDTQDTGKQLEDFPKVTPWEVKEAIKQTKKGTAPGPDNITIDLLRKAGKTINRKLAVLFNLCLKHSKVPDDWNTAIIMLLYKKGNPKDLNNYRPISLLNCVYKLFTKIITNRITKTLDENQPREQAGFRRSYSTMDHLHSINQLKEKAAEYRLPLAVAFIDFKKAFDSVEIPKVMEAISRQGVDPVYVEVLKHIYNHGSSFIRLHKDSDPFQLQKGVRQGDTSSPKLFTACLEMIFRRLDWESKGIKIDGEYLSNLRFADDIALFAENLHDLQLMIDELNEESKKVGLHMNFSKTKIMCNNHIGDKNTKIEIEDTELEKVDHYIYLGQRISMRPSKEEEIKRRITLGWQAFGRASSTFKNNKIPLILKRRVYNQCILPIVTYGAETWNLTKRQTRKLRTMQRAHERIMLGLTWRDHKTAQYIREKTRVRDIIESIKNLKWRWAGHVARMADNRWTSRLTTWIPRDHMRNRGRQNVRWRDELDKFRKYWLRDAHDREVWQILGKVYVQRRTLKD